MLLINFPIKPPLSRNFYIIGRSISDAIINFI